MSPDRPAAAPSPRPGRHRHATRCRRPDRPGTPPVRGPVSAGRSVRRQHHRVALGQNATCTINNNDTGGPVDPGQDRDQRQRWHRGADRLDPRRRRARPRSRDHRLRERSPTPRSARAPTPCRNRGPGRVHRGRPGPAPAAERSPARASCSPNGASATCTINNNDQPAVLTLVKTVTERQRRQRGPGRLGP